MRVQRHRNAKLQRPKNVKEAERKREGAGRATFLVLLSLLHVLFPLLA
jgi:hypothetical protein